MSAARADMRLDPALFEDLRRALRAEVGARTFYGALAPHVRDRELGGLLAGLHEEEVAQVEDLRRLITTLGGKARAGSLRRALSARILALAARLGALKIALRLCHESESTVARGYVEFGHYLARAGRPEQARACEALALTKVRHALALEAWVPR